MDAIREIDPVGERQRSARIFLRIVWGFALVVILGATAIGFLNLLVAETAPQQAAAAASGCFFLIAPYVIARSIQGIAR